MRKDNERGAIVVEATLSLTAFVFVIFTLLSIVNIYYIQAKMSVALNSAAKEISQYSYLYYKIGLNKLEADLHPETADSRATAEQTIDGVGSLLNSLSGVQNSISTGDFESMMTSINSGATNVDSLITMYADKLADDPKGFIIGMGKLAGEELKEEAKVILGQVLAKTFMQKNLKSYKNDDPDQFLRRYRVVDGIDGLDFDYTALMAYGTSNQIQLVVTYDVQVIRLLNIDFKFTFRQCAKTTAWGNGISLINPEHSTLPTTSIWDNPSDVERGKIIVLEEKKNHTYTSSGNGYDAFNNAGGANEYISIISVNTHNSSYTTADGVKNVLSSTFSHMYSGVDRLGDTITVQNQSGANVSLSSPKDTRTYKIVIVVPDDADMSLVQQAKTQFETQRAELGDTVVVEIKTGYGSPTPTTPEEPNPPAGS